MQNSQTTQSNIHNLERDDRFLNMKNTLLQLPENFVLLYDVDPTIVQNLRYLGKQNFVGEVIDGYYANKAIMTKKAAQALSRVQQKLNKDGYSIVVYDAYRPQKAVNHFIRWAEDPNAETQKTKYYPKMNKLSLFTEGYLAKRSGHSRGSTVDISIIKLNQNLKPIQVKLKTLNNNETIIILDDGTEDFGSSFDLLHQASHFKNDLVEPQFIQKRQYLRNLMVSQNFKGISTQWWHFTLLDEPYPDTYFNFDIV